MVAVNDEASIVSEILKSVVLEASIIPLDTPKEIASTTRVFSISSGAETSKIAAITDEVIFSILSTDPSSDI